MNELTDLLKFYESEKLKFKNKNIKKIKQTPNQVKIVKQLNKPSEEKSSDGLFFDKEKIENKKIENENNNKNIRDDSEFLL
jgi:hypothetical protein